MPPSVSTIVDDSYHKVSWHNPAPLQDYLAGTTPEDTYLSSPTYFFVTGRKGLWVHKNNACIVCIHPNDDSTLLVYPSHAVLTEHKNDGAETISGVIEHLKQSANTSFSIKLCKIELTQSARLVAQLNQISENLALSNFYGTSPEEVLDWRFPVRILDTKQVKEKKGTAFDVMRNKINKINRGNTGIECTPIDPTSDMDCLVVAVDWATQLANNGAGKFDDLLSPYKTILELRRKKELGIEGFVFRMDGQVVGFSLWEVDERRGIANSFTSLCSHEVRGLSEYQNYKMCEHLSDRGIGFVNIGGSETKPLDRYKRKFVPVRSILQNTLILV